MLLAVVFEQLSKIIYLFNGIIISNVSNAIKFNLVIQCVFHLCPSSSNKRRTWRWNFLMFVYRFHSHHVDIKVKMLHIVECIVSVPQKRREAVDENSFRVVRCDGGWV